MIEKIPVLTVSGASRNRNLIKLHQALGLDISSQTELSYFQTEAGPGGEGAQLWAGTRWRSEGGDVVRRHHQERRGRPR